jgi:hypothetical protein
VGDGGEPRSGGSQATRGEASFRAHLASFLLFSVFMFVVNVLTSPGNWWFYWPVFFWLWAVVIHAVATYGAAAPSGIIHSLRSLIPRGTGRSAPGAPQTPGNPGPDAATAATEDISAIEARVARLWRTARQIPNESVRERAFRVCAAADRVAEALATDRPNPELAGWFSDRYLTPAETILERYVRLAGRDIAAAEPALRKVEDEDLPLLESRLDELYDRLHRGDVIELSVASEMLDLDLADQPPRLPRTPPP